MPIERGLPAQKYGQPDGIPNGLGAPVAFHQDGHPLWPGRGNIGVAVALQKVISDDRSVISLPLAG